jgi:succinyl-CoA synthetase beta subunit
MRLFEYLAKAALREAGVPVPDGEVCATAEEVRRAAERIGPVAVKAQVLVGGRGKAGGVRFGDTPEAAEAAARAILGMDLKGHRVERVYAESRLDVERELYVSVATDRAARRPLVMASAQGGVEIESVPDRAIVRRHVDITWGAMPYVGREVAAALGLSGGLAAEFASILERMYAVYRHRDAELVEVNPLVVTGGHLVAADARLNIDDSALFRHRDLPQVDEGSDLERRVREIGLAFVELDGDIAVMANGAGMAMATLDAIQFYGGRPANFLDAGGGASVEPTAQALAVLVAMRPKVIFINIFGGITRCDDVAEAILQVRGDGQGIPVPLVVRLVGTREAEGVALLRQAGIEAFRDMGPAAERAVALAQGA